MSGNLRRPQEFLALGVCTCEFLMNGQFLNHPAKVYQTLQVLRLPPC